MSERRESELIVSVDENEDLRAYPAAGAGSQFTSTHQHGNTYQAHISYHMMTHEAWQEAGRGTKSPKTNLAESVKKRMLCRRALSSSPPARTHLDGPRRHGACSAGQVHHPIRQPCSYSAPTKQSCSAASSILIPSAAEPACVPQASSSRPWVRCMVHLYVLRT